jgi:hypothetical protein
MDNPLIVQVVFRLSHPLHHPVIEIHQIRCIPRFLGYVVEFVGIVLVVVELVHVIDVKDIDELGIVH